MTMQNGEISLPSPDGREMRQEVQLACFKVGPELYALDIMRIKEIINPLRITPVPSSSDLIEGVINLRGVIIPVVDLRKRFGVPEDARSEQPKYIIVLVSGKIVGVIVDEVLEVVRIPRDLIKPSPQLFEDKDPGMFLGVCEHLGRLLLLIDLKRVLSPALFRPLDERGVREQEQEDSHSS